MNSFTLLHVANAAVRITTVDREVLAAGIAVFAALATVIWLPALAGRSLIPGRRLRRQFASAAVSALVFIAVLPAVLPYDHLFLDRGHDDPAEESVHASHCHITPGTCSDAPVTSGLGQLLLSEPLVLVPAMLSVLMVAAAPMLAGISIRPDLRPPLSPRRIAI